MNIIMNSILHIKQYRLSVLLNVIGLAIAFVVAYSVLPGLYDTYTFNSEIKDCERVFRLETRLFHAEKAWTANFLYGYAKDFLEKSPLVESFHLRTLDFFTEISLDGKECENLNPIKMVTAEQGLKETLGVEIISGSWNTLFDRTMNNVAISSGTATKLNLAVGCTIYVKGLEDEFQPCNIVAIYKDMPENSDFDFELIHNGYPAHESLSSVPYIKLYDKYDSNRFVLSLMEYMYSLSENDNSELYSTLTKENVNNYIRLTPLSQSIYVDDLYFYVGRSFDKSDTFFAISIMLFLFIIAFINYFNLFMALVPQRIQSANIKKIMGVDIGVLRVELLVENLLIVGLAILLSLGFIFVMESDGFSIALGRTMADTWHITVPLSIFMIFASTLCILYPAYYITSFTPSFVLKGRFSANRQGVMLRNILLALQFVISYVLIVCTFVMYNQYNVSISSGTGFNKENLYLFRLGDNSLFDRYNLENMRADVLRHPDVETVTFAGEMFSYHDYHGRQLYRAEGEPIGSFWGLSADRDFLDMMGVEIVSGRNFNEYDGNSISVIVDEYTAKLCNIQPGARLDEGGMNYNAYDVVGVCKNFRYMPSSQEKRRFYLKYCNDDFTTLYIRAKEGHSRTDISSYIKEEYRKYQKTENYEPQLKSIDEAISDSHYSVLDAVFEIGRYALFAVFVSLLGVFGLVYFETHYRRKEIAIRRVNGALCSDIISMFGKRFIKMLLACYVVSLPVALFIMEQFLRECAYKAPVGIGVFIFSFFSVALLTLALVAASSWQVVNRNPTEVLAKG